MAYRISGRRELPHVTHTSPFQRTNSKRSKKFSLVRDGLEPPTLALLARCSTN
jgi:hypothetical protein